MGILVGGSLTNVVQNVISTVAAYFELLWQTTHLTFCPWDGIFCRLIKSNKMQLYADICLLLNYSTCFGRPSHPSSVHETVVAASGTGHTIWEASFFKRDQISTQNKQYTEQHKNFGRVRAVSLFAGFALAFALQLRKNQGKPSVRVAEECQLARWRYINRIHSTQWEYIALLFLLPRR